MHSLRELYRIGPGPSASHTMGPRRAAELFCSRHPTATRFSVALYGSLAATGRGHLTDVALVEACRPRPIEIVWRPRDLLPLHPNGMEFLAYDVAGSELERWRVYSVGGGALREEGRTAQAPQIYGCNSMEAILRWAHENGKALWQLVDECEGPEIRPFLAEIWKVMQEAVGRGLAARGTLPGVIKLERKSALYFERIMKKPESLRRTGLLSAYTLAVSEENAAAGRIVTAPTCGACGVLPGVLYYHHRHENVSEENILRALATAGLVGNLAKTNASISGAEVGCQGEVGTACAMAAAAVAQLQGGSPEQIEYAAEMGIEHHLGLTCDPVAGLVQIPCIERNAVAASRAVDAAAYAMLSDGQHKVSFDQVIATMKRTGLDMKSGYRETAEAGLASTLKELNDCG